VCPAQVLDACVCEEEEKAVELVVEVVVAAAAAKRRYFGHCKMTMIMKCVPENVKVILILDNVQSHPNNENS
jgi:hypothetical protein